MCVSLKKFIDHHYKGSITEFSSKHNFRQASVSRYASGDRIPKKSEMVKIYLATGGAVTPNDFYDLPLLESERSQLDFFKPGSSSSLVFPESTTHSAEPQGCQV